MKFFSFDTLLGKDKNKIDSEEEYNNKLIAKLREDAKEHGLDPNGKEMQEIHGILERKVKMMENVKFTLLIFRLADALHHTIKKAKEDNREPEMTDIAGILMVMLIKMEKDGHITINE